MRRVVTTGGRLDVFLQSCGCADTRTQAKRAVEDGRVSVNGKVILKPALHLRAGDDIELLPGKSAREASFPPTSLRLQVLFEDSACLVLNKPAGISVHPAGSMRKDLPTVLSILEAMFAERSLPFSAGSVLVHRLDKETTGCLLVAKTPKAHLSLQRQFHDRTVGKQYIALAAGTPHHPHAVIDAPVGRNTANRTKMGTLQTAHARSARTTYKVLSSGGGACLLLLDLHTGRTHQVRVHLASIGHPVLGDAKYASASSAALSEENKISSLALHAWKLRFLSPDTGEANVSAPPPETLIHGLASFKLTLPK